METEIIIMGTTIIGKMNYLWNAFMRTKPVKTTGTIQKPTHEKTKEIHPREGS